MKCKWCNGEVEVKCLESCKDCRTLQRELDDKEFKTLVLRVGAHLFITEMGNWTKAIKS